METQNTILIGLVILVVFLMFNNKTEPFIGYDESANLAPARPQTEFLADNYLKHAIISPRGRITVLSPTPPIKKTNCVRTCCPKTLKDHKMNCWFCAGFGHEYEI